MSADPYAERALPPALEEPSGEPPWAEAVADRGGVVVETAADVRAVDSGSPTAPDPDVARRFLAVLVRDSGAVPPLARLTAAQAAAWLLAADVGARLKKGSLEDPNLNRVERGRSAEAGGAEGAGLLHEALAAAEPILLVKHGTVAGPPGERGARAVDAYLIEAALDAALAGTIHWERDPDFGWDVAARVPGIEGEDADALCPRLLYARHRRAYEHAALVPELKRRLHERLAPIEGIDQAILAASGWPPEPTADSWKE